MIVELGSYVYSDSTGAYFTKVTSNLVIHMHKCSKKCARFRKADWPRFGTVSMNRVVIFKITCKVQLNLLMKIGPQVLR